MCRLFTEIWEFMNLIFNIFSYCLSLPILEMLPDWDWAGVSLSRTE